MLSKNIKNLFTSFLCFCLLTNANAVICKDNVEALNKYIASDELQIFINKVFDYETFINLKNEIKSIEKKFTDEELNIFLKEKISGNNQTPSFNIDHFISNNVTPYLKAKILSNIRSNDIKAVLESKEFDGPLSGAIHKHTRALVLKYSHSNDTQSSLLTYHEEVAYPLLLLIAAAMALSIISFIDETKH